MADGDNKVQEHSVPTDATIKQLYGVTSTCAFPGCGEPLYRMVGTERVLNSTAAHIHARRSNGPRWDPGMTDSENRSAENLVVLCLLHSKAVDAHPDKFPADVIRSWKRPAENGGGVALTDPEVHQVIESMVLQEIALNASVIKLGGELGGGGGAIGLGAQGGNGGPVYYLSPDTGDLVREPRDHPIDGEDLAMPQIAAGQLLGFDGQPGGTTAVMKSDGEVLLAAGGGGPDFVGTGNRSKSALIKVSSMMLAEYVRTYPDGTCSVVHGGLATYRVRQLPALCGLACVVVLEAGHVPRGEYAVHVNIIGPDGQRSSRATLVFTIEETGRLWRRSVYVELSCNFRSAGSHTLEVASDVASLGSLQFQVVDTSQRAETSSGEPAE